MSRFGEPWYRDDTACGTDGVFNAYDDLLFDDDLSESCIPVDELGRAVLCVNALAGLNPDRLGKLLEALDDWAKRAPMRDPFNVVDKNAVIIDERDEPLYSAYRALREEDE